MNQITVLIADDLPLLVDALADLLGGDASIAVVGTANDAVAAVEAAATARPDVAMPEGGGATFVLAFPRSAPLRRA